jgi:hypothetical protein
VRAALLQPSPPDGGAAAEGAREREGSLVAAEPSAASTDDAGATPPYAGAAPVAYEKAPLFPPGGVRAWTSRMGASGNEVCSNRGLCDYASGLCRCFAGFAGEACQRSACAGATPCSGRGACLPLEALVALGGSGGGGWNASDAAAQFAAVATAAGAAGWEAARVYACDCDSAWPVGFGAGQTQVPQAAGVDCAQTRCPSGDDPRTAADETDCEWADDNGATWRAYVDIFNNGTSRAIGVANYNISHLQEIVDAGMPLPSVNQVPFHLYNARAQAALLAWCAAHSPHARPAPLAASALSRSMSAQNPATFIPPRSPRGAGGGTRRCRRGVAWAGASVGDMGQYGVACATGGAVNRRRRRR